MREHADKHGSSATPRCLHRPNPRPPPDSLCPEFSFQHHLWWRAPFTSSPWAEAGRRRHGRGAGGAAAATVSRWTVAPLLPIFSTFIISFHFISFIYSLSIYYLSSAYLFLFVNLTLSFHLPFPLHFLDFLIWLHPSLAHAKHHIIGRFCKPKHSSNGSFGNCAMQKASHMASNGLQLHLCPPHVSASSVCFCGRGVGRYGHLNFTG